MAVAQEAEALLRELLAIPPDYQVLFLQGGARGQFAAVPMNLAAAGATVDYLNTGIWSKKAIAEAQRFARVNVAATRPPRTTPPCRKLRPCRLSAAAAYLHYTPNETIGGVEFPFVPDAGAVPLVADMSSTILSRPLEVARFGLIYAGAQKNIGPAGLTLVIVRDDLLGRARAGTPAVWDYQAVAAEGSMLNTPPTFAWYVAGLVLRWLKAQGGLPRHGRAQPRQGAAAVRGDRCFRFLSQPGGAQLPLLDERAVHAARTPRSTSASSARRARQGLPTSRATARSAACARASTTRCRWQG